MGIISMQLLFKGMKQKLLEMVYLVKFDFEVLQPSEVYTRVKQAMGEETTKSYLDNGEWEFTNVAQR